MWWMWIVGPALVLVIYVLTSARDKRSEAEVERWRAAFWPRTQRDDEIASEGGYRKAPALEKAGKAGAKKVASLPGPLHRMVLAAGGGDPVANIELVPKLAYLAARAANATNGSDHQTVVARLDEPAPAFTLRPLPIIEGERVPNTGVAFKKDPDFMALFLVEPFGDKPASSPAASSSDEVAKKIRGFLSRPIRDALRELPEAWLRVEEKAMALTLYGPADAEKIDQLVTAADVIFAEYGAGGGPSLFGEEDEAEAEAAPPPPKPKKKGSAEKPAQAKR